MDKFLNMVLAGLALHVLLGGEILRENFYMLTVLCILFKRCLSVLTPLPHPSQIPIRIITAGIIKILLPSDSTVCGICPYAL